ncbi:hypothetical protein ILYODFUR_001684 [Ilyodon furcidens]|uniref:Uncharacterized protein n=1 Tax=Ilyodon furcidens TaxID=33524 RepID=A0ABV0UZD3_9TELE
MCGMSGYGPCKDGLNLHRGVYPLCEFSPLCVGQTDEVCDGLASSRSFPEVDGDEDGAELDDKDEDSTVLISCREAAKPPAVDDDSKPAALCPLDMDVQDMCKSEAARLSIPWPAIQAEVAISRFDRKKLPKARKTGKHVVPVFPELLDEIAVTWRDKP